MIKNKKEYIEAFNQGIQLCPICSSDLNKLSIVEEASYIDGKVKVDVIVKCEMCNNRMRLEGKLTDDFILDEIVIIEDNILAQKD